MDITKRYVNFYLHMDEIVEHVDFHENRLLLRPLVIKMLEKYQTDYNNSIGFEKEHREKENEKLVIWQRKRQAALKKIIKRLTGILINLDAMDQPLKEYHNDCMGAYNEIKT